MAIVQGIVSWDGTIVRSKGRFQVISKAGDMLRLRINNQRVGKAFVFACPWRNDGDIGIGAGLAVSPDEREKDVLLIAVSDYYGVSFRIEP